MSAYEVCDVLTENILSKKYDLIVVNFANSDMVGHTGVMDAAVKAVEAVDECIGRTVDSVIEAGGQMIICADHGNSDQMIDYETGEPMTAHTTNPVPLILVNYTDGIGSVSYTHLVLQIFFLSRFLCLPLSPGKYRYRVFHCL